MLESALLSAVIALTATTAGLISVGRRPLGRLRVRLAMPVAVIALLIVSNAPTEGIVVGSAIAAIGLLLPRNWYAVGAWFFASLVVAFVADHVGSIGRTMPKMPRAAGDAVLSVIIEGNKMYNGGHQVDSDIRQQLCTTLTEMTLHFLETYHQSSLPPKKRISYRRADS